MTTTLQNLVRLSPSLVRLPPNTGGGVPRYRWFNGIRYELLLGPVDGAPLKGADGNYLYGVA